MPVLKQSAVAPMLHDPKVVLDLGDLQRQADRMIEAAEQEARRIVDEAVRTAEEEGRRIRAEAEARGRAEGEQAGRESGEAEGRREAVEAVSAELAGLEAAWTEALRTWSSRREADLSAAQQDVVALAVAIAGRIVQREIQADPEVATRQVAAALAMLSDVRDARVFVHPEDRQAVAEALPGLVQALASTAHVELREDSSLGRGGVVVRSGEGVIDARIDLQIRRIAEALAPDHPLADRASTPADAEPVAEESDAAPVAETDEAARDAEDDQAARDDQDRFGAAA
jgi:flagellar assembly protein FliH